MMSLARSYFDDDEQFRKSVCEQLKGRRIESNGKRLYEILKSWDVSVVTTNYDLRFDRHKPRYKTYHSIYDKKLNQKTLFKDRFVLHIHGSIEDTSHMVLTEADYFNMYYGAHKKRITEVMEWIFSKPGNVILFIGSGLNEMEILQFTMKSEGEQRFFNLSGFFSSEKELADQMRVVFDVMNIQNIYYNMDEKCYDQLTYVLENWSDAINRGTNRQSDLAREIRAIVANKPTKESKCRITTVLKQDPSNIILFCNNLNGKYSSEWCTHLMDVKNPKDFMKLLNDNEYACRLMTIALYTNLDASDDGRFRAAVKDYLRAILTDNAITTGEPIRRYLVQAMFRWPIHPLPYKELKEHGISELDWYPITMDLIADLDRINNTANKALTTNTTSSKNEAVEFICDTISLMLDNNSYMMQIRREFTEGFIFKLDPRILCDLYPFFYGMFKQNRNNIAFGDGVGAVSNIMKETFQTEDMLICRWLSESMKYSDTEKLRHLTSYLDSDNRMCSTMALNAVNLHWLELKMALLEMDDLSGLNYSELYDLLGRNRESMTDEDKRKLKEAIDKSDFGQPDEESIEVYRSDLLKAMGEILRPHPNQYKYYTPLERGKTVHVSFDPIEEEASLGGMDQLITALSTGDFGGQKVWSGGTVVHNFLANNRDLVMENLSMIRLHPMHFENVVLGFLADQNTHDGEVASFFDYIISSHLKSRSSNANSIIYLEIWLKKNQKHIQDGSRILHNVLRYGIDEFLDGESPQFYDDRVIGCYHDWYALSVIDYCRYSHVCKTFDASLFNDCIKRMIQSEKDYQSGLGLTLFMIHEPMIKNQTLDDIFKEKIRVHNDRLGIIESWLNYVDDATYITDMVCGSELFDEILKDETEDNRNIYRALEKMGTVLTEKFLSDGRATNHLSNGIENAEYSFLNGVISRIGQHLKNDPDANINELVDLIILNWNINRKCSTHNLVKVISEDGFRNQKLLDLLAVMYTWDVGYIHNDIEMISELYGKDRDRAVRILCALTEGKKVFFFDSDVLNDLVSRIVKDYPGDERVKRIINSLYQDHGMSRYLDMLRYESRMEELLPDANTTVLPKVEGLFCRALTQNSST